jgi:hypothetical protein
MGSSTSFCSSKNQSDNRKKAQESNKVLAKYLLTARTVEEKEAMPPTNDRRVESLKGPGVCGKMSDPYADGNGT